MCSFYLQFRHKFYLSFYFLFLDKLLVLLFIYSFGLIAGAWRRALEGNAPRSSWGEPVSTVTLALDFFLPVVVAARGASVDVSGGSHSSDSFVFLRYHFHKRFERQTYVTEWFGQNVGLKLTLRFG